MFVCQRVYVSGLSIYETQLSVSVGHCFLVWGSWHLFLGMHQEGTTKLGVFLTT